MQNINYHWLLIFVGVSFNTNGVVQSLKKNWILVSKLKSVETTVRFRLLFFF